MDLTLPLSGAASAEKPLKTGLQMLGLSAEAEAVYRALLRRPNLAAHELRKHFLLDGETFAATLQCLRTRGLVLVNEGLQPAVWRAVAPELAIEILLLEKQAELIEARRLASDLRNEMAAEVSLTESDVLEIVPADNAARLDAYTQMWDGASKSVLSILRAPLAFGGTALMNAQAAAVQRGVQVRTILSLDLLSWPGIYALCAQAHARGEQVRTLDGLFSRMLIVDGEVALLPLDADDQVSPLLRIRACGLLRMLVSHADALWRQASQVLGVPDENGNDCESVDSEAMLRELITVLAAGCNDKSAAARLGVSQRTLTRRIGLLSELVHARSRFQCGWLAARMFEHPDYQRTSVNL